MLPVAFDGGVGVAGMCGSSEAEPPRLYNGCGVGQSRRLVCFRLVFISCFKAKNLMCVFLRRAAVDLCGDWFVPVSEAAKRVRPFFLFFFCLTNPPSPTPPPPLSGRWRGGGSGVG